jgi:hypothetical protein
MSLFRILSRGWLGFAAALLLAPAAGAFSITGFAISTTGTNTADSSSTNGNNNTQVASSTTVLLAPGGAVADTVGSALSFQTNYQWDVMADRDNNGNGGLITTATAAYQITFTVNNPTGATYQIDIDTLRAGALTTISDTTGDATVSLGAVTGTVDAITNATLALATVNLATNAASTDVTFSQNSSTLSITSSALTHAYTLAFTWTGTSTSNNDEAAIRMGLAGTVAGVTADDYPGTGARTAANDGHRVSVTSTIISAPEPAPAALVALGLIALALRRRTR